jgi:hypothetical protein
MPDPLQGDLNELNVRPGFTMPAHQRPPQSGLMSALTFGLNVLSPNRVSPRMLEGLKTPTNPIARMVDTQAEPSLLSGDTSSLTNEQMTAMALQQAMALRK